MMAALAPVHSAKDAHRQEAESFLLLGPPGSGKTAQLLTLPGRTFVYEFDPAGINTLKGSNIDYLEFLPDRQRLEPVLLDKASRAHAGKRGVIEPKAYSNWEADFEARLDAGFFDDYDNIGFDSLTTFADALMDQILWMQGRPGQFPGQDDYGPQMTAIRNVFRTLTALDKTLVVTGHEETIQDETTKRILTVPLVTGKLKVRLPLLFSEIFHCECRSTAKDALFVIQTRPDRMNPNVRCTIQGLEMYEDVTIKDWSKPEQYGLGRILVQARKQRS